MERGESERDMGRERAGVERQGERDTGRESEIRK